MEFVVLLMVLAAMGLSYYLVSRPRWIELHKGYYVHRKAPMNVRPEDYKYPTIHRAKDGRWRVIFPNGNSMIAHSFEEAKKEADIIIKQQKK